MIKTELRIPKLQKNIHSIALIETSRIHLLTNDNEEYTYNPLIIDGLPNVPIIIYPRLVSNDNGIIHELNYKLFLPNIKLPSIFTERYINNGDISFEHIPNMQAIGSPIIYDNEDIHTLEKLPKYKDTTIGYITSHKRKIYEFAEIVNEHINKQKTKTLK